MKVTVITPTANRYELLKRCAAQFEAQDYPDKEWLIADGSDTALYYNTVPDRSFMSNYQWWTVKDTSLGHMRNFLCLKADGDIILHMDDDDIYAPDWISKSVAALLSGNGNVTGLSKAYFKEKEQWYLYQAQANAQPYVCGATMCYYRSLWLSNPFPDVRTGEDLQFQAKAIVRPHGYIDGFTATIHGGNTCSHKYLQAREFTKIIWEE